MRRGSIKNRVLDMWVGTPLLHLLAALHRRRGLPEALQRIGVMCSPALGDTLLFSGPLQDLRAAYPTAQIVHFCMQQNLAAAEIVPGADRRVLISLTQPAAAVRSMRAERLDALLDFTAWQRLTALYALLAGARYAVGFRTPKMHRAPGYDCAVEHRADRHELENFRALLREGLGIGAEDCGRAPAVAVAALPVVPFADEPALVVLHPWASGQRSWLREWPEERWVELASRLAASLPRALFVVTGAPSDRERSEPMAERLCSAGLRAEAFVSPDGFCTLTHVLRNAMLVVSVNTGVMHLAAVAGAPTVSLNGPTAEHRWGARGRNVANVQPADGSGGYLHLGFEFKGQPEDVIQRISVAQVLDACATVMARAQTLAGEAC